MSNVAVTEGVLLFFIKNFTTASTFSVASITTNNVRVTKHIVRTVCDKDLLYT